MRLLLTQAFDWLDVRLARRPHYPHRPSWACQRCAQPWPCAKAKAVILADHIGADRTQVTVYLAGYLGMAYMDLGVTDGLHERIVGWAR
jgi:hypothetical protein